MKNLKRYSQLFENTQELTQEQSEWLDKCTGGTWKINPQTGLVDVNGNFNCQRQGLTDFKGVRFGYVNGIFNCSYNELKSLKGAPRSVRWNFSCPFNDLTSLEGAPQSVGGSFDCYKNSLTSLEGAPQSVGGNFHCSDNELKSLDGAPQSVGMDFSCSYNDLTSLEGAPQIVGGFFNCYNNPISQRAIKGVVKRMVGKKISLEQAVAEYWRNIPHGDKIYLAKHHPTLPEKEKKIYGAIELNMKRR